MILKELYRSRTVRTTIGWMFGLLQGAALARGYVPIWMIVNTLFFIFGILIPSVIDSQ